MREVERVAGAGFKEIALTGVHLGSYGRDLAHASSLPVLLHALDRCRFDVTFRISSLEPMDCTRGIVEIVSASGGRFAPHFHLPLQHASDRMLARMRRPYSLDSYRDLVDSIARSPAARVDRQRHDRRFSGGDRRGLRCQPRIPAGVAAVAPARVSVLRSSGHGGSRDAGEDCRRRDPGAGRALRADRRRVVEALSRALRSERSGPA